MRSETLAKAAAPVFVAAISILGAPSARGVDPAAGGQQIVASIRLRGSDYDRSGFYGADDNDATGSTVVPVGGTGLAYVSAGTFRADGTLQDDGLCFASSGTPQIGANPVKVRGDLVASSPHVWWAEFRVFPAEIGKVDVEVTWEHVVSARPGEPKRVAGDTRRIRMREGQNHVLDFVDAPPTKETSCYRNIVAEVTFAVREDPALAAEKLAYDLWLEHTGPDGTPIRRRFQAVGAQGKTLEFGLEPIRLPTPTRLSDGTALDVVTEIVGKVQARIRPDGDVDVRLGALRWIGAVPAGTPRLGGTGIGGEKSFKVKSGETVSLPLPAPQGGTGFGPNEPTRVDHVTFYEHRNDTLILTVTRVR